jgi:hypothetical protein
MELIVKAFARINDELHEPPTGQHLFRAGDKVLRSHHRAS